MDDKNFSGNKKKSIGGSSELSMGKINNSYFDNCASLTSLVSETTQNNGRKGQGDQGNLVIDLYA